MKIAPLTEISEDDIGRIITGYESKQRYDVRKVETPERTEIVLDLVDLAEPFVKQWDMTRMTSWYRGLLDAGLSFGAFESDDLMGIAITQAQQWNSSAMVWELHVVANSRGRGIGRQLLHNVERAASDKGLRRVVCETQSPNVAAIGFYRACGYSIEGVDLTYYAHDVDNPNEVAIFMKKAVEQ